MHEKWIKRNSNDDDNDGEPNTYVLVLCIYIYIVSVRIERMWRWVRIPTHTARHTQTQILWGIHLNYYSSYRGAFVCVYTNRRQIIYTYVRASITMYYIAGLTQHLLYWGERVSEHLSRFIWTFYCFVCIVYCWIMMCIILLYTRASWIQFNILLVWAVLVCVRVAGDNVNAIFLVFQFCFAFFYINQMNCFRAITTIILLFTPSQIRRIMKWLSVRL